MGERTAINASEWDLLEALWRRGAGTARDLEHDLEARRGWAYSTVKTLLDRMVEKGLVKSRRVGSVWEYEAAVAPLEARRAAWKRFVGDAFGGALGPALEFLATEARLTRKQRESLRALLDATEKKEGRDD